MAVYTKLSTNEIETILFNYELGNLTSAQEVKEGVENTNYILNTTKGKYILTIFEKRVNHKDLPFFINLMNFLAQNSFPCPQIFTKNNSYLFNYKAKTGIIISFLNGDIASKVTLNNEILYNLGCKLAKMHNLTANFSLKRENDFSINGIEKLYQTIKLKKLTSDKEEKIITNILNNIKRENLDKLSKAIIHADLFPDNIFIKNNEICGVIDFYFSCYDFINFDIATTINAWCFDENNNLNTEYTKNFLKGYNLINPINIIDRQFLSEFCLLTSVRFFLTRLYDEFYHPENTNITAKNPKEFLDKIIFWQDKQKLNDILATI